MAIELDPIPCVASLLNLAGPELTKTIDSATTAILSGNSFVLRGSGSVQLSPGLLAQRRLIEEYDMLNKRPVKDAKKIALNTLQTPATSSPLLSGGENLTPSLASSSSSSGEGAAVDSRTENSDPVVESSSLSSDSLLPTSNFESSVLDVSDAETGLKLGKRKRSDDGEPPRSDLPEDEFPISEPDTGTAIFNPDDLFV